MKGWSSAKVPDLISVIVTTYNREDALEAVLSALSRQSDRGFEVVVADDGSRATTAAVVERWRPRLGVPLDHVWQMNCGFRAAEIRNRAILVCHGDYCIFLDGDCIAPADFVATHRRLAERGWFVTGNRVLLSSTLTAAVLSDDLRPETWSAPGWIRQRLRGGVNRLAACYDFSVLTQNPSCASPKYKPWGSHGTGVFGLLGGLTNNSLCSAGIAPGASHFVLTIPNDLWNAQYYSDILLWAAGFKSPTGWPAVSPPNPGAAIINCSHGADYLPLSNTMDATFQYLVNQGRGTKGTLVVYSAGNRGLPVATVASWAAHPDTMAIACSELVGTKEGIWVGSNYGPEIAMCALGQSVEAHARLAAQRAQVPLPLDAAARDRSVRPQHGVLRLPGDLQNHGCGRDLVGGEHRGVAVDGVLERVDDHDQRGQKDNHRPQAHLQEAQMTGLQIQP